jgi:hypothetical protein
MTTIILGNGNNLSVSDDNSIGDTIILGHRSFKVSEKNPASDVHSRSPKKIRRRNPTSTRSESAFAPPSDSLGF